MIDFTGLCGTCRWWRKTDEAVSFAGWGVCDRVRADFQGNADVATLAMVIDEVGSTAVPGPFMATASFGCQMHEAVAS